MQKTNLNLRTRSTNIVNKQNRYLKGKLKITNNITQENNCNYDYYYSFHFVSCSKWSAMLVPSQGQYGFHSFSVVD